MNPASPELIIHGQALTKTFKDFWGRDKVKALRGVDIAIPKGALFGLLGPNGAGKSTLIKLILGHLHPSSGQLSVFGKDPRDVASKYRLGYLPERSYLYKNLTAQQTLSYFGAILGLSQAQIESRSAQLLDMVGLAHAADRQLGQFSHGMTRRLGLAQALLNDPDLLILDEPTAGLDPTGCREVKDLIIALGRRGKTILLTSHLLADVEDVCSELMVIYGGMVKAQGSASSLLAIAGTTRIDIPAVPPEILAQALAPLQTTLGPAAVQVSTPRQSLESFFIDLIRSNAAAGLNTSGAAAGTGVADFLQDAKAPPFPAPPAPAPSIQTPTPVPAPLVPPPALAIAKPIAMAEAPAAAAVPSPQMPVPPPQMPVPPPQMPVPPPQMPALPPQMHMPTGQAAELLATEELARMDLDLLKSVLPKS